MDASMAMPTEKWLFKNFLCMHALYSCPYDGSMQYGSQNCWHNHNSVVIWLVHKQIDSTISKI